MALMDFLNGHPNRGFLKKNSISTPLLLVDSSKNHAIL